MSIIPGWDSVAGSHWWSNAYFWGSIGALILLGITEIVSHRYSERKDELSAIEQEATKKAHENEIARLHNEAAKANERAGILEKEAATARLQTEQLKQLVSWRVIPKDAEGKLLQVLLKNPGSTNLLYTEGDPESLVFADQFRRVLTSAGWSVRFFAYRSSAIVIGNVIPGDDAGATKTLREAFSTAGIPFTAETPKAGPAAVSSGEAALTSFSQAMPPGVKLFIGSKAIVVPQ